MSETQNQLNTRKEKIKMREILDAEIELVELLKNNDGFKETFKTYLGEVFKSAKSLCKGNHLTVYYDFKKSRFIACEFMHDWEYTSGEGVDLINLLTIRKSSQYFVEGTIDSIVRGLQREIKYRKRYLL